VFFHPLRDIPGPKFAAASIIPYARVLLKGNMVRWLHELHKKHGEVVRISPNELSYISGETAWQDIYGFHTGKKAAEGKYLKDRNFFAKPYNGTWAMLQADTEAHSRMRRNFSHGFSDKALREQEPLVQGYVELLIQRLHEQVQSGSKGKIDLVRWYNFCTFE
jgi:cytochrome P450